MIETKKNRPCENRTGSKNATTNHNHEVGYCVPMSEMQWVLPTNWLARRFNLSIASAAAIASANGFGVAL